MLHVFILPSVIRNRAKLVFQACFLSLITLGVVTRGRRFEIRAIRVLRN
jgi:hypothetical protein